MTNLPAAVTAEHIASLVAHIQAIFDASKYVATSPKVISCEPGKRYARLVVADPRSPQTSRSCYGFLDLGTGDLLKAAGWKGPAKNFARGNVLTGNLACCSEYSVS